MKIHQVRQGENLQSIAVAYGLSADEIWQYGQNKALGKERRNGNCLLPGDRVCIPESQDWFTGLSTGQCHRFVVKRRRARLRLSFFKNQKPRCEEDYVLHYDDKVIQGKTDSQGKVDHELPFSLHEVLLTFSEDGFRYRLQLRHLDPVETVWGVQARLFALGFYLGKVDGLVGPKSLAALSRFQRARGLQDTARIDDATQEALYGLYDEES